MQDELLKALKLAFEIFVQDDEYPEYEGTKEGIAVFEAIRLADPQYVPPRVTFYTKLNMRKYEG
jgi:hypothetical protein